MSNPYDQTPGEPDPGQNPGGQDSPGQNSPGQNPAGQNAPGQNPYQPDPYQQNPYQPDPYQQNPYQANPYQQNPYGGGPQPHPQGTTVLVLGIVGLVACGVAGIVGLVIGNKALKEIDANPSAYSNRSNVVVGRVLSIISIILWAVVLVFYLILGVMVARYR